jgi:hypothetical protein
MAEKRSWLKITAEYFYRSISLRSTSLKLSWVCSIKIDLLPNTGNHFTSIRYRVKTSQVEIVVVAAEPNAARLSTCVVSSVKVVIPIEKKYSVKTRQLADVGDQRSGFFSVRYKSDLDAIEEF